MPRRLPACFAVSALIASTAVAVVTTSATAAPTTAAPAATRPGGDGAATYRTVPTARLLDTRTGNGAPKAQVAGRRTLALTVVGRGGVPTSNVSAVAVTLTVARPAVNGYLSAYPSGADRPTASNVNFAAGHTQANAAIVRVGADGKIVLFNGATGAVDVVADVSGYYLGGEPTEAGSFGSLTPSRLLDTRDGSSPVPAKGTVDVPVAGRAGVPASGVSAAVVTITAVGPTAGGYLTAYAKGAAAPATSTVNFTPATTVANLAVVAVGSGGAITVANSATDATHVIVDVAGYVVGGSPAAGGSYQPVTPKRIRDTRTGIGGTKGAVPAGRAASFLVGQGTSVPSTRVSAVVVNVTATAAQAHGYVTAYRPTSAIPTASALDYAPGRTAADLAVVPVGPDNKIALYNGGTGSVQLITDIVGYYVLPTPALEPVPDDTAFDTRSVSCAPGLCLAIGDAQGNATEYAVYNGSSWSTPADLPGLGFASDVSCTSSTFCLVTDSSFTSSIQFNGTSFAAPVALPADFDVFDNFDFDCASSTLCLVEGSNSKGENNAARYNGTSWSVTPTPPITYFNLDCDATSCTVVQGTRTARFDGSTWSTLPAAPLTADQVSCAASRCLEIGHNNSTGAVQSAVLANGAWGAVKTLPAGVVRYSHIGLSCVSATWCMVDAENAIGGGRSTVRYTIFDGTAWSTPANGNGFGASPSGGDLSCGTTTLCARADGALSTWTGSWSTTAAFPGRAVDVSCAAVTSCLAIDDRDFARTFDGSAWTDTPPAAGLGSLRAVSCVSASFCVAVGARLDNTPGAAVWNGVGWGAPAAVSGLGYAADVSCTSTTFCLAVGGAQPSGTGATDTAVWSRFTGSGWTSAAKVGTSLLSTKRVSCLSSTSCATVARTSAGHAVPATFTGTSWRPFSTTDSVSGDFDRGGPPISCAPATTTCRAANVFRTPYERLLSHSGSGTAWTEGYGVGSGVVLDISCTTTRFCVAAGIAAIPDSDADQPAGWIFDGSGWSTPATIDTSATPDANAFNSVSCVGTSFCAVTSTHLDLDPGV